MNKYEKIAKWIIAQEVKTGLKDSDIKEIGKIVFDLNLSPKEIKMVKDALAENRYFNFKDSPDWETLKNSKDFILKRLFRELEEEKSKPMSVEKENNIAQLKSDIRKRAKEIKNVPNDIWDNRFKDAYNEMTPLEYIQEALDKEGIEYEVNDDIYGFNPPYYASISILDPNDIDLADEIICNIVGYAYQVHRDKYGNKSSFSVATEQEDIDEINGTSIKDKKFKDSKKAIITVWLINKNSKKDLDVICRSLNTTYKIIKETPTELKIELKGDVEGVVEDLRDMKMMSTSLSSVRYTDSKFKDSSIEERLKKETNNFTKSFTGNIIVDGKDLMQAVRLLQKYYIDVDWKKLPPIKPSHPSGKQVPQYEIYGDTRKTIKDSEYEPNLEYVVVFDNLSPVNCDTVEEVKDCIKKCKLFGSKAVEIQIYAPNGSTSVKNLRELKEFIEDYKEQMSLGDSKLTHKQKLWYAGEIEKFIEPKYLKRNYTLKKIKRGGRK